MIRAYKYRFYPSKEQKAKLDLTLQLCCRLYNAALEQRQHAYKSGRPINYGTQQNQLPELKEGIPEYFQVQSQVLQNVLRRVDRAFTNFFGRVERRRKGAHIAAGYPRFKPSRRYNSITYPQTQKYKIIGGQVTLPKVGKLRVFMHRDPVGEIKTMTVKRDSVGDWYIIFTMELPDVPQKTPSSAIGIDVGLIKLVQASNGEFVEGRQFYYESEEALKRAQRQLSRKTKGSKNREKARIKVAKIHRKIQRRRDYFLHKVSKELVSRADLLVFEDLPINNMVKNPTLSKSIYDASWGKLYQYASYKASSAGRSAVRVDSKGTTRDCACGNTVKLSLSDRVFQCPKCGLTIDRDLHGSFGALRKVGWEAAELTPVEMRPLLAGKPASLVKEAGSLRR
ncbi:MAG TPA: transposase [Nitrososphaerales archaeon]|nr:transposase [Nitrososphaerales archaeon]